MRYPILPMMGITLSLTAIAGSVMAIPNFLPESEPKKLHNIDISSLWTSHPMPVDRSKQNLERLPALVAQPQQASYPSRRMDVLAASTIRAATLIDQPSDVDDDYGPDDGGASQASEAPRGVAVWCNKHYRSYRASDNTYQPYSGARRQCLPPLTASPPNSVTSEAPQHLSSMARAGSSSDEHAQWCFARYRSYNSDDNTYRAFSGEIRACDSPYI
jgi:hypothetical protein